MLFETRRVPLHLTPLGHELLALTQKMFSTSMEIENLLSDQPEDYPKLIRLVADSPAYAALLAKALADSHPGLGLEVQIENARVTFERLLDARADIAIVCDPPTDPRLVYKPLFVDKLKLVAACDHPLAESDVFPLAALETECLLLREPASKTRAATESLLVARDVQPARTIVLHSREAIREAIAVGLGVSLFFSSECPPDERLAVLEPDGQPSPLQLTGYLVCSAARRRSRTIQALNEAASMLANIDLGTICAGLNVAAAMTTVSETPAGVMQ